MAKRKRKAYVVTKGRQTGIFETWDEAEPLVKGFSGAKYQGYNSLDEAERAWRADQAAPSKNFSRSCSPLTRRVSIVSSRYLRSSFSFSS